jgi:hypothetical protein
VSITYAEVRDREHLRLLTPAIDAFIKRARYPPATGSTGPRQTVFFFAGGIASALWRAKKKFQPGTTKPQTFEYEIVWLNDETHKRGYARRLKMHRDDVGIFRDKEDYIIVPSGMIWDVPYAGFIDWCANNNLNLLVVDYDWRRRLEDTVTFFLHTFLPFFKTRVLDAGLPDPLAKFSLIGHSMGGMIVNLILRGNDPIVAGLARAITVATPFYGYPGQLHCYFEGHWLANGDNNIYKQEIMKVVASLPAPYTLQYLDEATYRERATQSALAHDPEFPLLSYPSMDATDTTVRADAYNPKINGSRVRYPGETGFDLAELDYGRLQAQQLVAPMVPNLAEKFYNIRGVITEDDQQTPKSTTPGDVTWDWVPTSFDATDPSPISDVTMVPGDETQPAWSTRLATNAPARCITVRGSSIEHVTIMNHARTLDALAAILGTPGAAMSPSIPPTPEPASDEDLIAFMRWLHKRPRRKPPWPSYNELARRALVPAELQDKLPGITLRIIRDIMKRPAPPGLSGPAGGGPRATRARPKRRQPRKPVRKPSARKPAARRRRRRAG